MQGTVKERWLQLCEEAVTERDVVKLTRLIEEINRLLEAKAQRLLNEVPDEKKESAA